MENAMTLTEEQVNQIIDYLSKQPFKDVYNLIAMLQEEWNKQHQE